MTNNYKILGCLSILGILAWIFYPTSTPPKHQKISFKKEVSNQPMISTNVNSKDSDIGNIRLAIQKPAEKATDSKRTPANIENKFFKYPLTDSFDVYPKTQISSKYAVVNGLVASFKKTSSAIRSIGGLYYYEEDQFQGGNVVVFDNYQEKYAMWSGEVIIEASEKNIEKLLGKFDVEIVSKTPGRMIFKAGPNFNLSTDINSIEKTNGVVSLSLDLKYSKLMRQ
ncbi:MAG: hypothetical protein NDI69_06835 [Bacteriovoracaceae bacterium]|nr:hypothetical protein [Bacteriovoracaceae bacterium]